VINEEKFYQKKTRTILCMPVTALLRWRCKEIKAGGGIFENGKKRF
jgi:hypothetical protein